MGATPDEMSRSTQGSSRRALIIVCSSTLFEFVSRNFLPSKPWNEIKTIWAKTPRPQVELFLFFHGPQTILRFCEFQVAMISNLWQFTRKVAQSHVRLNGGWRSHIATCQVIPKIRRSLLDLPPSTPSAFMQTRGFRSELLPPPQQLRKFGPHRFPFVASGGLQGAGLQLRSPWQLFV